MRTITLELLRQGPAHNQLLSPLTPYLALCEGNDAVTLHVPFEHNQFLHRLDALGYKHSEQLRLFQLADTAAVMRDILAMVPGLAAEANKRGDGGDQLTHLRLIISASELAILPFELALAPAGFPGAGQHLLLQSHLPVCLTRQTRRSPDDQARWLDRPPRILFAAATPPEVGVIPLESHLLALRRAIEPWVNYYEPDSVTERNAELAEHLVFLPQASIEDIENECRSGAITHVHILAHGVERQIGQDQRFFLALHGARDPNEADYVSGTRLATALRATERSGQGLARPAVVTLASCDAGNVGSVAGAGASIAHALHDAGIAMVVAGQFPLSFDGSVRLVEILYEGLLWGGDPRGLVHDLRRRLLSQFPDRHDWASITAYLSLPDDFDRQLSAVQINQVMKSIQAAMDHADELTARRSELILTKEDRSVPLSRRGRTQRRARRSDTVLLDSAAIKLESAKNKLRELCNRMPDHQSQITVYLASTEKRQAEILFHTDPVKSKELLVHARDNYWKSFTNNRTYCWAIVQYLSLDLLIRSQPEQFSQWVAIPAPGNSETQDEKQPAALWNLARLLSLYDLNNQDAERRGWAHANLIELYLLALAPGLGTVSAQEAVARALEHTDGLLDISTESFEAYSTRRQMLRYLEWYPHLWGGDIARMNALAKEIFTRFPADLDKKW